MTEPRRLPVLAPSPPHRLYAAWMHDALGGPIPDEPAAPCDACVMVGDLDDPGAHTFAAETKCCTHLPSLPNFLVGAALAEPPRDEVATRGVASLRARIAAGRHVTPLGLFASPSADAEEARVAAGGGFGRVAAMRCPHYVDASGGLCGIWAWRNATCVTWFCKHERGLRAHRAWRALEQLLRGVEAAVARHCLLALGLPAEAIMHVMDDEARDGERLTEGGSSADRWGPWAGREEAFFVACAEVAAGLSWDDVLRLGGAQLALRARVARHLRDALSRAAIPSRLRAMPLTGAVFDRDYARVATYSRLDPVSLPYPLLAALWRFDGRETEEVRAEIEREHGLLLDDEVLGTLVDFGVLVSDAR